MFLSSSSPLIRTPCLPAEVLDSLAEGVVVIGQEGNIVFTNPSFERLLGYDPGELLGQYASVLDHDQPGESTTVETLMSWVLSQGVWQGEVLNRKKDGTPFTTYTRATIFEMDGKDYYVSVQEDITQRRHLGVQFHERERLALIGTVAVNMSHKIGNRLNSLSSSVQMLERSFSKPTESLSLSDMAEIVQDLKAETSRMEEVLWALRELSIPDRISLRPVDVGQVARRVLQAQYARCTERQIQHVSSFPEPVPLVLADRERLTQVLTKLCDNAIDAMPSGGALTVEAAATTNLLSLSVHDTGAGIAENIDPFEPFLTTRAGGSGLGLAVVKQLVLSQGGTIVYSSNQQNGTTFTIRLPIVPQSPNEMAEIDTRLTERDAQSVEG